MSDIFGYVDSLTSERRALLAIYLREKRGDDVPKKMIPRIPRQDGQPNIYPLSFVQEGLWFLNQLEPDNPFYNMPTAFRLRGSLNIVALEQSLNEITKRHEVLRTTYPSKDGQPIQVVIPFVPWSLPVVDLRGWPSSERDAKASELIISEARRPFNLAQKPPFRAALLELGDEDHLLFVAMHHIVADHWSIAVIVRELEGLYTAFSTGSSSPLPELPIQYVDFAVWQRNWLQGEVQEKQLTYWKQQLNGAPSILELPTDRPRSMLQSFQGASQHLWLPEFLLKTLKTLGRQEKATLYMVLLAAFNVLLYRYTGQEDIVVGTPISSRNRCELEGLIGYFLNTLVLRTSLVDSMSFRELLGRVREVAQEAYLHQDLPLWKLVAELQPERDLSYQPLFQVMFNLQSIPMPTKTLSNLIVTPFAFSLGRTQFDLDLYLEEVDRKLRVILNYNTDLFDAATIRRMIEHFRTLLEGIVANPDCRLSDLPVLTEAERHQLLVEWIDTQADYAQDKCIHELFEAQVRRVPDAVVMSFEGQHLTYWELNRRANQLAHYLQGLGVGPETLVGICVDRSLELVIGLLGILKSGGAYVPLDLVYPQERLAFMLEDTRVPILLTQSWLLNELPEYQAQIICLDVEWEMVAHMSQESPPCVVTTDNVAYTIYTSGSTGRPKGVQVLHSAVVNFLESMCERPGLVEQDTVLSVTALSFDIAVLELFLPLAVGACVELVSRLVVADSVQLMGRLADPHITVMQATPVVWRMLMEAGWQGREGLKVLCGGEELSRSLADELLDRGIVLWNMYGPTETTVWSTIYEVEGGEKPVSIGRPIGNTQVYLLDAYLRPVPLGVPGKLYIGGNGLARGYLNQPVLIAERFIPNPFSTEPGARLYYTGDLARYLPDGNIEFLGRIDYQVKVRGFRIELREIEAALEQHQAVREAVVLAREDGPSNTSTGFRSDKWLVAYVVSADGQELTVSELRNFLQQTLPGYMVPTHFMMLEALPLTPNGKIDRQVLPAPDQTRPELKTPYVSPRSEMERRVAAVWKDVLHIERVGVNDNFFDLGGHSLLVTQVHNRLQEAFGKELTVLDLFRYPSIGALVKYLNQEDEQSSFQQYDNQVERSKRGKERLKQQLKRRRYGKGEIFE